MAFLESLAAQRGRPVMVAAMLVDSLNPERILSELDAIDEASARGNPMFGQVSCSPMIMDFRLDSAYPFEILDTWRQVIPIYQDRSALTALYADQSFRQGVREDLKRDVAVREYTPQFDRIHLVETASEEYDRYVGMTVAQAAETDNVDPLDWFLDCGIATSEVKFSGEMLNVDEDLVSRVL